MAKTEDFPHRGRFQAQSDYLEQSKSWACDKPPTAQEGHDMLGALEDRLDEFERDIRRDAFIKAHRFIDNAGPGGVGETSKSYPVRGRRDGSRVDIEVKKGIAFVQGA
jgi:hypothetical protein